MRNTAKQMRAAQEINSEVYEADAIDTMRAYVENAGWTWIEPQVVTDPAGVPHYISAEVGFAEQVHQVYQLHKQLASFGMLA